MSLKAENLSFSYENGGRHVLTRISLKIEPGERVGLVRRADMEKRRCVACWRDMRDRRREW